MILGELWLYYKDQVDDYENWREYFDWADVALPLSYMYWQELITGIEPAGRSFIEDAWTTLCSLIDIDADAEYKSLGDCFAASPNSPVVELREMEM